MWQTQKRLILTFGSKFLYPIRSVYLGKVSFYALYLISLHKLQENPFREKTNTVKDTNNPEYNETFHVPISRQSRTLLRIFKGKHIKFEVWAKGYIVSLYYFCYSFLY